MLDFKRGAVLEIYGILAFKLLNFFAKLEDKVNVMRFYMVIIILLTTLNTINE